MLSAWWGSAGFVIPAGLWQSLRDTPLFRVSSATPRRVLLTQESAKSPPQE